MVSIAKQVKESIPNLEMRVFDANIFLEEINIPNSKKDTALKELSRLENEKVIQRVTNGVYATRKISRITKKEKPASESEIVSYYTKRDEGMTIGYDLYNRKNISTQISKRKRILSSNRNLNRRKKVIKSVTVEKIDLSLNDEIKKMIEMLEIIENSNKIQDFNPKGFFSYMYENIDSYDENVSIEVISKMNYKKQTIYNLDKILQHFGKDSGLEKFLNKTSHYKENLAYESVTSRR